jgi:dTDP-4-dehydrorhamnose reductase
MKLLLLGADGQVGSALQQALAAEELRPATRRGKLPGGFDCLQADLADITQLVALIERERPDWILNAAAYTAVDRAEDEPELADRINGSALADIGAAAQRIAARVLHYSTDYVFPGTLQAPWREDDRTAPVNHYGQSKLRGEIALRESGASHLILRTAWVYGPRGNNFLRTMLRLGGERPQLGVVADQFGTPTTAQLIAAVSARLISELKSAADTDPRWGTYHLTAAGHTSWHQFASAIFDQAVSAGLIARRPEVKEIASADYPTRARRPNWSVLDNSKLQSNFGLHLPDWQAGLATTLSMIADERSRWPHPQ